MQKTLARLRPYAPGDLEQLALLLKVARGWPPAVPPAPEDVATRWARRHIDPARDITVLPDAAGELVAFSLVTYTEEPTRRVSMELAVHPDQRRRGIGSALHKLAVERAHDLQVAQMTTPVYLAPRETRPHSTAFLEHRGFLPTGSYWQMRLDNIKSEPGPRWPEGFHARPITHIKEDGEKWAELVQETFRESTTGARIAAQLAEPGSSPDGYFFAVDERAGLEVGTSRARIDMQGGKPVGYVGTVGVLPDYRNRGLATALMQQTLQYLATQGMESAVLFVEGANLYARRLYEKLGWRPVYQTVHYWKTLLPEAYS